MYVVVTGPPGAGKSTLSRALADALGLPLLAKDEIKQQLIDEHPVPTVGVSREVGAAAVRALLVDARDRGEGVLDSVWVDRSRAVGMLAELPAVVEVFCRCDVETMRERYVRRSPTRGPGHFDYERPDDELWPSRSLRPLAGGWPVVEVDTSGPVDVHEVVARLR